MFCPKAVFLVLLSFAGVAAGPETQPATQPNLPKERFALMNGAVRFMIPGGWKEVFRDSPDHNAQFNRPDGKALFVIGVTPQEYGFPKENDSAIEQLKTAVIRGMKAKFKERGDTILYGPRSESDSRFVARIHDRIVHDGKAFDEVHTYRALGLDLVMVLTQVETADPNEAKPVQEMGEDVCLSIILGPADKKKPKK